MNRVKKLATSLKIATATISVLLISPIANASSTDLITLYNQAVNYDADIAAARAAYTAETFNEDISFSRLLPTLEANASIGHTNSNKELSSDDSFGSSGYSVRLTQPIINFATWKQLSSSELNSLRAEAVFQSEQQDLILAVATAYFKVLREQENLTTAKAEEAAVKRQYEQAQEQFEVGLIAITDVHEAKASYDSSQTLRIRSEGNLTIAVEDLSRLTGQYVSTLHQLKSDFPVQIDESVSADQWVKTAFENNLSIKAAEFTLEALQEDYNAKKSEHYPTLSLSASYETSHLRNFEPEDNTTEDSSVFLTLNVPLYSGGATSTASKQLRSRVEEARHNVAAAKRRVKVETRTQHINLLTNMRTVESLNQNIISRESALEATREGYNVGTRNIVEVLDAERNYFSALRDYANARFDFVESSLRIKLSAGTLSVKDLEELNNWLTAATAN